LNPQPLVAIVILNWNGKKYLEQFLPSVLASAYAHRKVVVADNASTDDSLAFLEARFPAVERIKLPENYGFAKGYNEALAQVQADYYVLLNSDVEVTPGWIEPIIELMEADTQIAACQPKMLSWHKKTDFEYAGAAGGWLDAFGYPFSRGRVFDVCEADNGQFEDAVPVFWASGAAMFIRAKLYHDMGGLDPYFFAHQEEIDLCWRLQQAGYRVYAQPASVVYHVGGGTLPKGNSRKVFLNFRNNLIMLHKNWPLRERWWKIPFRLMLDAVSAWKALLSGDAGYFLAVARAHRAFLGWRFFHYREALFPVKRGVQVQGLYRGCVVWDYFIRKKRRFGEIVHKTV
jgi:GT2 family glycosyltransferase